MNREDRYKITSYDYADLMIQGPEAINAIRNNPEFSIQVINNRYGVAYLPVDNITVNSIERFGYAAMPKIYGLLSYASLEASGINRIRNDEDYNLRGQGVLIGFIDTGIDYTNAVFRNSDGLTRIVSIWDQTIESENDYPENFYYGTEYSREQINRALQSADPFLVVPSIDAIGHGTMLAGVAAGAEIEESGFSGVAPEAEMAVVKLKTAKPYLREFFRIPDNVICYQENDIMLAIDYLLDVASRLNRPIVICLGLGTNQGDHQGSSVLGFYLQDIGTLTGISAVAAAGNEGGLGHHYFGEVNPSRQEETISLNIAENETGFSMELWGYVPNIVEMDIYSPGMEFITHIPSSLRLRETREIFFNNTSIVVDNQISESNSGDQLILIRFQNPESGIWRFVVEGTGDLITRYHVWLPMHNFISEDTYFLNPNSYTTLSEPANVMNTISVTAYNTENETLFINSSRGFTKTNGLKPDIAAPGVDIAAPGPDNTFIRATGTGIAAAHAAGAAALLLEWGIVRRNLPIMNNVIIRRMLVSGARRYDNMPYPNPDWGFGILDIYRTITFFVVEGLL